MYREQKEVFDYVIKQADLGNFMPPQQYIRYINGFFYTLNCYRKKRNSWRLNFYIAIFVWISISVLKMIF